MPQLDVETTLCIYEENGDETKILDTYWCPVCRNDDIEDQENKLNRLQRIAEEIERQLAKERKAVRGFDELEFRFNYGRYITCK